jgi:DNA/RNA-binding domain of Phe-tRNA-synthetase-like protein
LTRNEGKKRGNKSVRWKYTTGCWVLGLEIQNLLAHSFPDLGVLELKAENLTIRRTNSALEELKIKVQDRIRRTTPSMNEVKDLQVFRAYRDFFWRVGVDPTKTRPAGEALIRRIISGGSIPTINTLVDSYNLASAETHVAIAAFDLSRINESALLMRPAGAGGAFLGIGMPSPVQLKGVEIVIEDTSSGKLVAVYPYRDSDDSRVTEKSKDVLIMICGVPGLHRSTLEGARDVCKEYIALSCR